MLEHIHRDLLIQYDSADCNLIFVQGVRLFVLSGIDIDLVLDLCHGTSDQLGSQFYKIVTTRCQFCIIHPEDRRCKLLGYHKITVFGEHTSS